MLQLEAFLQAPTDDLGHVITLLRNCQKEFFASPKQEYDEYISKLFSLTTKDFNFKIDEWNRIRFYIYSHIVAHQPKPYLIPVLSLETDFAPLFKITTTLYTLKRKTLNGKDIFKQALFSATGAFDPSDKRFYSRNAYTYLQNIPELLADSIPKEYTQIVGQFISSVNPTLLNDSLMSLIRDMINVFTQKKFIVDADIIQSILEFFKQGMSQPFATIFYFFIVWFHLFSTSRIIAPDLPDQIEIFTLLVEKSSITALTEFIQFFSWDICLEIFNELKVEKHQSRLMPIICLEIRTARPDGKIFKKFDMSSRTFLLTLKNFYENKTCWMLLTFTEQMIITLTSNVAKLKMIKLRKVPPNIDKKRTHLKVTFEETIKDKRELVKVDSKLYALLEFNFSKKNNMTIQEMVQKDFKAFDLVCKNIRSASIFYTDLMILFSKLMLSEENNSQSTFYFVTLAQKWFKFMIEYAYTYTFLQIYLHNEYHSNPNDDSALNLLRMFRDMGHILLRMQNVFSELAPSFFILLATILIPVLRKAVLKHRITNAFVTAFEKNFARYNIFKKMLILKMHQYFIENLSLFTSKKREDVEFMHQWLLLTIKISGPEGSLPIIMRDSQRQVVTLIINHSRHILFQKIAIGALKSYAEFMTDNLTPELLEFDMQKFKLRLRRSPFEEFHPSVRVDAAGLFINNYLIDFSKANLSSILAESLKSSDPTDLKRAIDIALSFVEKDQNFEQSSELYHNLFVVLKNIKDEEIARQIFSIIPKLSYSFVSFQEINGNIDPHTLGKNRISTLEFLNSIDQHLNFDDFELFNLYGVMRYILMSSSFGDVSKRLLKKYLFMLNNLATSEKMIPKARDLFSKVSALYLGKNQTLFFLSLVTMSNVTKNNNAEFLIECLQSFISQVPVDSLRTAADGLFSFAPYLSNLVPIVLGLTELIKKSSELVEISHIKSLSKTISPDMKLPPLYNMLLKIFLLKATMESKVRFIDFAYSILGDINVIYKYIIIKRMRKIGIPINIEKVQYSEDVELVPYQTSACLLCGNSSAIPFTNEFHGVIQRSLKLSDENNKSFNFWMRGLMLAYAILRSKCPQFLKNSNYPGVLVNFIQRATMFARSMPLIVPLSRKALVFLLDFTKEDDGRIGAEINKWYGWPDSSSKNIIIPTEYHKLNYYFFQCKADPSKIFPNHFKVFFEKISEYSDLNEPLQMQYLSSFYTILKLLALATDKSVVVPGLNLFLSSYGKLYQTQELAFRFITRKEFFKIISLAPSETASILISSSKKVAGLNHVLELFCEDVNMQKHVLVEMTRMDYSSIQPHAFSLLPKIAKNSKDNIIDQLQNLYSSILRNYEDGTKKADNESIMIYSTAKALFIATIKNPTFKAIQICAKIFVHPEFHESKLYGKFKRMMRNLPNGFLNALLNFILLCDMEDSQALSILLKQTIKILPFDKDINETLWNYLLSKINGRATFYSVCSCIYALIKVDKIDENLLKSLLLKIEMVLTDSDSRLNMLALKIAVKLLAKKLLPDVIHHSICEHLLTFPKFFDLPFYKLTILIFSKVEKPSRSLIDVLVLFFSEKILSLRQLARLVIVIQYLPRIEDYLPFEIVPSVLNYLNNIIMPDQTIVNQEPVFMSIIKCVMLLKVSDQAMAKFSKLSYDFICKALQEPNKVKAYPDHFFTLMLQKDKLYTPFPTELIRNVEKYQPSLYLFKFICFIVKFAPFQTVQSCYSFIVKTLEIKNDGFLVMLNIKFFIQASFKTDKLSELFITYIESMFDKSKNDKTDAIISVIIAEAPNHAKLRLLQNYKNKRIISPHTYFILAKELYYCQQEEFIGNLLSSKEVNYFSNYSVLVESPNVTYGAKYLILNSMIKEAEFNDCRFTIQIIDFLNNNKKTFPRSDIYILRLSVSISHLVDQKSRLLLFKICDEILGDSGYEIKRFITLLNILKTKLWNNNALPFIVLLCSSEKNQPLIAFSNFLSECSNVSKALFERIIKEPECPNLRSFYMKCLTFNNNTQVVKDLTAAFQTVEFSIPDEFNWKGGRFSLMNNFDFSTFSNERLLYPNNFSDFTFATLLPTIEKNEIALILNFSLSIYTDFDIKIFTYPIIEKIHRDSSEIYRISEMHKEDFSMFYRHNNKLYDIKENSALVEQSCMHTFQHRNDLTRFDLERIVTIETLIRTQTNPTFAKTIDIRGSLSTYFSKTIEKFERRMNNSFNEVEHRPNITRSEDPYILMAPHLASIFNDVSGFTKHGFIAVSAQDVEKALNRPDSLISQQSKQILACFTFNMFMNMPTPIMATTSLNLLFDTIETAKTGHVKYEAATRIITVLRLCMLDTRRMFVVTEAAQKITMNSVGFLKIWVSQLQHIAKNDEIRNKKQVFDISSIFTRYSMEPLEIIQRDINRSDANTRKSLDVLYEFHVFVTNVFNNKYDLDKINSVLPIQFPNRAYGWMNIHIIRIHHNIKRLSETRISFTATTPQNPNHQFIIERVNHPNEVASFSNALYLLNLVLKKSYTTSCRSINYAAHLAFEIGPDFILFDSPNHLVPIENFDEEVTASSSCFFFKRRTLFIQAIASYQFLRNLFCLPQPLIAYKYSKDDLKFPVMLSEFTLHNINENNMSDFHIPDKLRIFLGPQLDGQIMTTVAAVAKSLADNIDTFRSVLEVLAFDAVENPSSDAIKNVVDGFEDRLLKFTPPDPKYAKIEDEIEWVNELLYFAKKETRPQNSTYPNFIDGNNINLNIVNNFANCNRSNNYNDYGSIGSNSGNKDEQIACFMQPSMLQTQNNLDSTNFTFQQNDDNATWF